MLDGSEVRTLGPVFVGGDPTAPAPELSRTPTPGHRAPNACWYAASTRANHEKRVAEHLSAHRVEHFLPLYRSLRRWKDRRVELPLPLFPGYVFVRIALCNRLQVLEIPSVARLVGFNGMPAALPESEIELLRSGLAGGIRAAPHPYLRLGRRVRLIAGPLAGLTGILLRRQGKSRLAISIDLLQRSVVVDVEMDDVEPIV